jgi:hypothetical protein
MADGVPKHIYEFPERYGMEKKGFHHVYATLNFTIHI